MSSQDVGVGATLNRRNQQHQTDQDEGQYGVQSAPIPNQKARKRKTVSRPTAPSSHRAWWLDLACGASIYAFCLVLPIVYRQGVHLYRAHFALTFRRLVRTIAGVDAEWTDFGIVAILSSSFACIRIALVHWLVGIKSPEKVRAMARCKSLHLLSSGYDKSLTPRTSRRSLTRVSSLDQLPPHSTLLAPDICNDGGDDDDAVLDHLLQPRIVLRDEAEESWLKSTWKTVRRSSRTALGVEDSHDSSDGKGLHEAPRFATAVFRSLYCSMSVYCALSWFGQSDFWPGAVGGSGFTSNCWNLLGSPGVEEDFDQMNSLLKGYYLMQASYHLHSGAFHMLTMGILWARKSWDNSKPFTAYWRSLVQHGIALLLIGGSHLFASTRRLGAIGSFVLDVSSLLLHILQICINVPFRISPWLIKWFHRGFVIPVFLYSRFYVWPFVVWKSVFLESHGWLQQMEFTLFPGIEKAIMWMFHALTLVLMGLNVVLLKRLLYHPHLQRVLHNNEAKRKTSRVVK